MTTNGMSPYETLGNAVVLQAVKDYRTALRKLSRVRKNPAAEDIKNECERFFLSGYFNVFTSLDGKVLQMQLKKEASL